MEFHGILQKAVVGMVTAVLILAVEGEIVRPQPQQSLNESHHFYLLEVPT
jgi:hypothetical protein